MADASPNHNAASDDESPPAVERHWRPAPKTSARSSSSPDAPAPPDAPTSLTDTSRGDEAPVRTEPPRSSEKEQSVEKDQSVEDSAQDDLAPVGNATATDASPSSGAPTEEPPDAAPDGAPPSRGTSGGSDPEGDDPSPADAAPDDPLPIDNGPDDAPDSSSNSDPPGDEVGAESPSPQALDEAQEAGKQINEEAFADADDDHAWTDQMQAESDAPGKGSLSSASDDQDSFFTDEHRHVPGAERVEEELQDFAYDINEGTADTDWTPSEREDRRIASMFARLVSKVAEDMSYQRAQGDEFWDPRKIMRRQIDRRPLRHCKKDYTKRRLALLVDTSPSCRDEAVFYSKIATGALLRDDIDIFLCPNGRIDAKFDPEPMRFVDDDRGAEWGLEGRVVLYFTDWDGTDELVEHSRDCTLYWFDNCSPSDYWESDRERHQRVRLRYRGRHFHCPDPSAFRRLSRKIRP